MRFRGRLFLAGLALLAPMALGAAALQMNGFGGTQMLLNFAAWGLGLLCYLALGRIELRPDHRNIVMALLTAACAAPFLAIGLQGVHRWVQLGPISANVAAMLLPAIICLLVQTANKVLVPALLVLYTIMVMQPDLSQMLGLALAAIVIGSRLPFKMGAVIILLSLIGLAITANRPDPLLPVPVVEGMVGLGFKVSAVLGVAMIGSLGACCALPWLLHRQTQAAALSAYVAGITIAPIFGAYPVPYAGLGMSFPIGLWLALGCIRDNRSGMQEI